MGILRMQPGLKLIVIGFCFKFIPLMIFALSKDYIPENSSLYTIVSVLVLLFFAYGYFLFVSRCRRYCGSKGYSSRWGWLGVFSLLVLPFLFLLKNRVSDNLTENKIEKNSFQYISVSELILSYFSISALGWVIFVILTKFTNYKALSTNLMLQGLLILFIVSSLCLFLLKYLKNADLALEYFIGFGRSLNYLLIIFIVIFQLLFAIGFYGFNLYYLSFIFLEYIEEFINEEKIDDLSSYGIYCISAVFIGPFFEEIFIRGMLLHKLSVNRTITYGVLVSSLFFALYHFRFDVIELFLEGVIWSLLYLKTKSLLSSLICHSFYNAIICIGKFYSLSSEQTSTSLAVYRASLKESLGIYFLLVAISLPYLIYFIYKNWPSNNQTLPYFANKEFLN